MFVVYTFSAVMGALFAALWWLRVVPVRVQGSEGEVVTSSPDHLPRWSLPLCCFGLVGVTLWFLGRPFLHTLALSLVVGPPVGLVAGWVSGRISGKRSEPEGGLE